TAHHTCMRAPVAGGVDYRARLPRFLENHDELRAAAVFPWPRHQAAAMVTFFAPGLRFFHQGQFEGARTHIPVHLRRGPREPVDLEITEFYESLLAVLHESDTFRRGAWSLISPEAAWPGNPTWQDFIAYAWQGLDRDKHVLVVNCADHQGQCYLRLPFTKLNNGRFRLIDAMGSEVYDRDGNGLIDP